MDAISLGVIGLLEEGDMEVIYVMKSFRMLVVRAAS